MHLWCALVIKISGKIETCSIWEKYEFDFFFGGILLVLLSSMSTIFHFTRKSTCTYSKEKNHLIVLSRCDVLYFFTSFDSC